MNGFDDTAGWWATLAAHHGDHLHVNGTGWTCSCGELVSDAPDLPLVAAALIATCACAKCGAPDVAYLQRTETGWAASWTE